MSPAMPPRALGHEVDRKEPLAGTRCAGARRPIPSPPIYHPYILEAGERGPFTNANARAQFIGLTHHTSFVGPGARGL